MLDESSQTPSPPPLSSSMTMFKFPCKNLMPFWASCSRTCPDDFTSGELLEVIRPAGKLTCKKPHGLGEKGVSGLCTLVPTRQCHSERFCIWKRVSPSCLQTQSQTL